MEAFFTETFVVIGCDDLTDMRLDALVKCHRARRAVATIGLVPADDVSQYGVVVSTRTGASSSFRKNPPRAASFRTS